MNTGRSGLTSRGAVVLGSAAAMTLTGILFGLQELYGLAFAAVVLVVAARIWVTTVRWDLYVTRQVHPNRVAAGREARVELSVHNQGFRITPPVEAADPFDGGRRWARFAIAPMKKGETRNSSYRLPAIKRGVYHLGPLELRIRDPLGVAQVIRTTAPDTSLTVHPRYDMVPSGTMSSHRDDARRQLQPVMGKGGSEFYALREYVPGDDLRHVHWATTARLDKLVIRQPENPRRGRVTVVADTRTTVHEEESIEEVLSATASIAMSSIRDGLEVRVVTTGGFDSSHSSGPAHGSDVLDGLAQAELHQPAAGAPPFRLAGTFDPVVIVTTDMVTEADLESAVRANGPSGTTVVIFATSTSGGAAVRGLLRRRTVHVPLGGSFQSAWTMWDKSFC